MKSALLALACVAVCLPVFAIESQEPPAEPPSPQVAGTLTKMDPVRREITLDTKAGPQTFVIAERTFIFRGKEKIALEKIQPGELVKLRFATDKDGRKVARVIKVPPPPAPE